MHKNYVKHFVKNSYFSKNKNVKNPDKKCCVFRNKLQVCILKFRFEIISPKKVSKIVCFLKNHP